MNRGKTTQIYLVDGTPTGTLTPEIMNGTGRVQVFPREQLADVAKREEARRTGVYLLVGVDPGARRRARLAPRLMPLAPHFSPATTLPPLLPALRKIRWPATEHGCD